MVIGLLLGISYIITGQLALAIGIHISWNFFMGYVYGFPISGKITDYSIFLIDQKGPFFLVTYFFIHNLEVMRLNYVLIYVRFAAIIRLLILGIILA